VFRHFPLSQAHPHAEAAAETAEFAGAHGRFWEMHDAIYENQDQLGMPLLFVLADALGLPEADLRSALAAGKYAPKVKADFLGGVRSGVNGTPAFFINGELHNGTFEFDGPSNCGSTPGRPCNLASVLSRLELSKIAAPSERRGAAYDPTEASVSAPAFTGQPGRFSQPRICGSRSVRSVS
ncbi:MAG: DsbA family protein, partial [Xanthobacteraceae bacterium]